jgi:hypothetical protein
VGLLLVTTLVPSAVANICRIARNIAALPNLGARYGAVIKLDPPRMRAYELRELTQEALAKSMEVCGQQVLYEQDGETVVNIACEYFDLTWIRES